MRKFIIKNYYLDAYFRCGSIKKQFPRCVKLIVPTFCLLPFLELLIGYNSTFSIIAIALLAVVFSPLLYLSRFPVRWFEMDTLQKFQSYYKYVEKNGTSDTIDREYKEALSWVNKNLKNGTYYNAFWLFFYPILPFVVGFVYVALK
ncbi:hypothetical protein HYO65_gp261 [Tenacibaculum phage PTm1]|uniref:Uncharacterized protein n=2 Tax=Shirahamavirus PTm1 TaxID=2846435 RepID=A0A5S9C165_9CAUD|nr:hypothetical protein HYO65_gp261 [Tenacibaculum phage PTm1]BBI90653.1 hypothetical protein [Tenacibaculum phage PTm1]BBI90958.1 hypothetical protein [Tenacibaculum phage PTm5]